MFYIITAAVCPAATHAAVRAALIPTEPQAIAVYVLLAWSFFAVWAGNRSSSDADVDDTEADGTEEDRSSENEDGADEANDARGVVRRRRKRRKSLSRAQRRKRGHVNWIQ